MSWLVTFVLCGLTRVSAETPPSRYTSFWSNNTSAGSESSSVSSSVVSTSPTLSLSALASSIISPSFGPGTPSARPSSLVASPASSPLSSASSRTVSTFSTRGYGYDSYRPSIPSELPSTNSSSQYQNGTVSNSSESIVCVAQCKNFFPVVTSWVWYPAIEAPITKTVTSYLYINAHTNKTSTSFSHDHAEGATKSVGPWQSVWTLTVDRGESMVYPVITFPTPYVDYAASYSVIASPAESEIRVPTGSTCATSNWYTLPSHPSMPQAAPATTPFTSNSGVIYGIGSVELFATASPYFFLNEFPSEGAFSECKLYKRGPSNGNPPAPSAIQAVQFLTETVISTTNDEDSPTITSTTSTDTMPVAEQANSKPTATDNAFLVGIASKLIEGVEEASASIGVSTTTPPALPNIINGATVGDDSPGFTTPQQTGRPSLPQSQSEESQVLVAPVGSKTISLVALPDAEKPDNGQRSPTAFAIAGSTVAADQTITLSGTPIAVRVTGSESVLVVGQGPSATTILLQPMPNVAQSQVPGLQPIVVGEATLLPISGAPQPAFSVAGVVLTNGGSITLGIGSSLTTVLALSTDSSGNAVIISNGKSSTAFSPSITSAPTLILDGTTYSAINPSALARPEFIISGQTLTLGGTITVGSEPPKTTIALTTDAAGHTFVVSNGHSSELLTPKTKALEPGLLTLNGQIITPTTIPPGRVGYIVSGQTLTQGGSVTFGGTVFTLTTDETGHTVLIENGKTSTISFGSVLATATHSFPFRSSEMSRSTMAAGLATQSTRGSTTSGAARSLNDLYHWLGLKMDILVAAILVVMHV